MFNIEKIVHDRRVIAVMVMSVLALALWTKLKNDARYRASAALLADPQVLVVYSTSERKVLQMEFVQNDWTSEAEELRSTLREGEAVGCVPAVPQVQFSLAEATPFICKVGSTSSVIEYALEQDKELSLVDACDPASRSLVVYAKLLAQVIAKTFHAELAARPTTNATHLDELAVQEVLGTATFKLSMEHRFTALECAVGHAGAGD